MTSQSRDLQRRCGYAYLYTLLAGGRSTIKRRVQIVKSQSPYEYEYMYWYTGYTAVWPWKKIQRMHADNKILYTVLRFDGSR